MEKEAAMKSLLNRLAIIPIAIVMVFAIQQVVLSEDDEGSSSDNEFVGAAKCKLCHNKEETGAQFTKWSEAKHSKTYELLGSDKAKAVAKELGIENPQESGKCLKCHSTAYFFTESQVANIQTKKDGSLRLTVDEGVSCESCHWAGSAYQKKKVMESFDESVMAGMNPKPEESCVKCHNDENPTWDPEKYTLKDGTKSGFDFAQAFEKIKHPNPAAAEK